MSQTRTVSSEPVQSPTTHAERKSVEPLGRKKRHTNNPDSPAITCKCDLLCSYVCVLVALQLTLHTCVGITACFVGIDKSDRRLRVHLFPCLHLRTAIVFGLLSHRLCHNIVLPALAQAPFLPAGPLSALITASTSAP